MTPIFRIFDYPKAHAFYIGWLGFQIDWAEQPGNPDGYLQVSRDDVVLHLAVEPPQQGPGSRARAEMRGLLAYHRRLQERQSMYPAPSLERAPWNSRVLEMVVDDPFGNQIIFCEPSA